PMTTATKIINLNVGGRIFTTLISTLTSQSTFFTALLLDRWESEDCLVDGNLFVDANPDLFQHILDYLRRSIPPVFWTRVNGFDFALYAALLQEARYFGIAALEKWIAEQHYLRAITIHQSIQV
ncbi:uncharacterized protein A1O5_03313, partial [Cladophialophora psammophila CBS 110553]